VHQSIPVPAALLRYVDGIWVVEGTGRALRVLPDGCADFLFDLDAGTACVVGTMSRAEVVRLPAGKRLFGVRFVPGALPLFVEALAHEIVDTEAALGDVGVERGGELGEQVAGARTTRERVAAVRDFLFDSSRRRRARDARLDEAIAQARAMQGMISVPALAERARVTERTLERLFRDRIGTSPKHFCRVVRLQRASRLLETGHRQAGVAAAVGYFDEPHLLREFRALAGAVPSALVVERRVGFVQAGAGTADYGGRRDDDKVAPPPRSLT
jgi:AraC-like DNA-binding protein